MLTISKTTPPFVLKEFFYTRYKQKENRKFLLTEAVLPPLTLTEEIVLLSVSPTDAVYFQDPDRIKETRFVYSKVFAEETCEILFSTISHSKYKIWLNGQYVGVCTGFSLFTFYLTLKKGLNEFVFEIDLANPNYYDFNNRIALRSSEEANPQSLFYKSALEYDRWIQFFQTEDCRASDCTCIFIPRCFSVISSAVIKVLDDFGTLLAQTDALPGMPITFSASALKEKSPDTIRVHLVLEATFTDGSIAIREQTALLRDYDGEKKALSPRLQSALSKADEYTKNYLVNEFCPFFSREQQPSQKEAVALFQLKKCLDRIESEGPPYYISEENALIYYRSALDLQYRKIRICRPPQLSTEHPGLIVFVNVVGNSDGARVKHILKEHSDLILVDLGVAGFSTGTPISESLIAETLGEVRKLYAFDERRIYWYGFCNNGSAIWSFCQNHPHLATKIVTVESLPDVSRIDNLCRTEKLLYNWSYCDPKKLRWLSDNKNAKHIRIYNSTHNYMHFYLYRAENFSHLDCSLPEYPQSIRFSTKRLRFNRSCWITLNSIRKTKLYASVAASVEDEKTIRIRLINCDDFTIKVPPQMQENFQVVINGVALFCEKQKSIRFVRKQNQFCISAEEPDISSRKGTGLLDVYYGPLRIVHDGSDLALLAAQKFSEPEAASFSPKLNVKYPIYGSADLPSSEINHNIILINGDTLGAKKLDLPIMVNSDGCESIDGTCYKGDCCVFQRVPNPYNPQNSVLHISSNNLEKFKHHLLLRKIILPSMLTGISPYWNNEALIITEDGFIPIYEW